ncbi:MAG TPA: FtsQ-type POTRA domain-containing protein [Candidatus Dormibacteraeota bacterium]|nr:FtsQ-type POTRA domain-containing protein [Candidatus Dormibacteraeota bacterium]
MKFLRRGPTLPRAPWPQGLERTEPLRGQLWTRPEKTVREPDVPWTRRVIATLVAGLEVALLGWLWFGPAFSVRTVEIVGTRHLTAAQVSEAAGLRGSASVLSVDAVSAQQHLLDEVWVRTATVQPQLSGTITVNVSEWQPVAAYHAGPSTRLFLLSSQAVVLGATSTSAGLVVIQGPAGSDPHVGDRAIDPQLLTALINVQRAMPTLIGQDIASFIFDSCGDLTMVAKRGWKVYFGRVLTPEEFTGLHDKLTALKAINGNGNVDYSSTDLDYVNVMNPSEPAVGYKSREPAPVSPSPGAPAPTPNPCK